jgi:hypothetical protein
MLGAPIEYEETSSECIAAARVLLEQLPHRTCGEGTEKIYARTFRRMWAEAKLDPLRSGDARDTYNQRRAALHWGGRRALDDLLKRLDAAAEAHDRQAHDGLLIALKELVGRVSPAIDRDPPQWGDTADFSRTSRWATEASPAKVRGTASKKHVLRDLPRDWILQLWRSVRPDHKYRDAIAVLSLSPSRPGEVVPGDRPCGFSQGIIVALDTKGRLVLANRPLKSHGGKYGMAQSAVKIDVAAEGPIAEYLAQRCREQGGKFVVAVGSSDALAKAIKRVGRRAFPQGPTITPYVLRSQRLADAKAAFGAGEKTALAAGHCTDRTQSRYGNVAFGRRGGLVGAFGTRPPRLVAVERARRLGESKRTLQASIWAPS